MNTIRHQIKNRFRLARRAKYRTLEEFAATLGEKLSTCVSWEAFARDVIPPTDKLAAICRALDVSADYLLGLDDEPRQRAQHAPVAAASGNNGRDYSITMNSDANTAALREAIAALAAQLRRQP